MPEPKMLIAIHPRVMKTISPKEFISEFGVNHAEKEIFAKCMHCGADVFTYGMSSIKVTSRFKHFSGKSCDVSTIAGGDHPGFDINRGILIKKEFCKSENILRAYVLCLSMVGKGQFSVNTFISLCKKANNKDIWAYVGIEVWMLPFMLLTLNDITLKSQKGTDYKIRFLLDKNFNSLSKEKNCNIEKIYANTQRLIKSFSVNSEEYNNASITWMDDTIIKKITSYCH